MSRVDSKLFNPEDCAEYGCKYEYAVYRCVHHHDLAKTKSKGKGVRAQQHNNSANCPLYFRLTYRKFKGVLLIP